MGIRSFIQREKEKFRSQQAGRQRDKIKLQTAQLEKERIRQGELVKLNAEKARLQRDVGNLQQFNQKVEGPSRLQRLGAGIKATINKGKELRAKSSTGKNRGFSGISKLGGINRGSTGLQFGGGSNPGYGETRGSPFSGGGRGLDLGFGRSSAPTKKPTQLRRKEIIIRV